jgi:uncharacterized cupin superfamily protein
MPEATLKRTEHGLEPDGEGWFIVNATQAPWVTATGLGRACIFESREHEFGEFGINIHVLQPGEPNGMYHAENAQEGFLVLSGEVLLLIEGEERPLRQWDFVHFPPGTRHIVVGAGDGPAAVLMVGTRKDPDEILYPVDPVAQRHGAGVDEETPDPKVAYAHVEHRGVEAYRPGDLPGN